MRLAVLGAFDLGDYATEEHVARDAEHLGHSVKRIKEPRRTRPRDLTDIESHALSADAVLYMKTWGLPPEAVDVWRNLEARGIKTCSYHLDLYAGLVRQKQIGVDPFWKTGTVFTADGGSSGLFRARGVNHRWMPAAVVSDETHEGTPRAEFDYDVVFVGSYGYHPAWPWRRELIDRLAQRYGARFHRYGQGDTIVRNHDLNDLYATARVVVGDSLALPGHANYFSDRYFETIGRGGFLVAPNVPGLEMLYTDGEHFIGYEPGDFGQVARLVDKYLDDPQAREEIADAGQAHTRARHTYQNRVAAMLEQL